MTSRSFKYFNRKKIERVVIRPVTMLERQHYGPAEWLTDFVKAWELSVVALSHLGNGIRSVATSKVIRIDPSKVGINPIIIKNDIGDI